jgi:triosephosphate isomerase
MRRPLVAGNWKMHGSRAENARLIEGLVEAGCGSVCEVILCPPAVYLWEVARQIKGEGLLLGAQNVCAETHPGAFTGEVSADMLADVGVQYVIVGHSERRALYGETDALVARKFVAAQSAGLVPILCVGETLAEREGGRMQAVIARQLDAVLTVAGVGAFGKAVVAYEPVWAIGTGKNATPDQAEEVHAFIRDRIAAQDATIAESLRLLYGGSVKAANAAEIFAQPNVDGGLVGGASLKAEEFTRICAASCSDAG